MDDKNITRSGIWIEIDPHMDRDSAWKHAKTIANERKDLVYMTQSGYCSMIVRPEPEKGNLLYAPKNKKLEALMSKA
jgi:hypothetical protein